MSVLICKIAQIFTLLIFLSVPFFAKGVTSNNEEVLDLSATQINSTMKISEIGDLGRVQESFNESKEFSNTLSYQYNDRSTYKIRLRTAMDTFLSLPKGEVITIFNFGDDKNFSFVPLKDGSGTNTHMGIIKNIYPGADTNLIIIGASGNSYNFYVRVDDHHSSHLPHLKVFILDPNILKKLKTNHRVKAVSSSASQTAAPGAGGGGEYRDNLNLTDYLRSIDNTPMRLLQRNQDLDFRYKIFLKNNVISPKVVFDDGYWTYFRMSNDDNLDKIAELPVLLKVSSGIEQPVNTRIVRNYIIAETTGMIWALRIDDRVLCVEKLKDHERSFLKPKKQ
jgi:ComB9 competence protein